MRIYPLNIININFQFKLNNITPQFIDFYLFLIFNNYYRNQIKVLV